MSPMTNREKVELAEAWLNGLDRLERRLNPKPATDAKSPKPKRGAGYIAPPLTRKVGAG